MTEFEKLLYNEIKGLREDINVRFKDVDHDIAAVEKVHHTFIEKKFQPLRDKVRNLQWKMYVAVLLVGFAIDKSDKWLAKLPKFLLPF